jgi:hypothetical protein
VRLSLRAATPIYTHHERDWREVGISAVDSLSDLSILGHFLTVPHNEGVHSQPVGQPRSWIRLYQGLQNFVSTFSVGSSVRTFFAPSCCPTRTTCPRTSFCCMHWP